MHNRIALLMYPLEKCHRWKSIFFRANFSDIFFSRDIFRYFFHTNFYDTFFAQTLPIFFFRANFSDIFFCSSEIFNIFWREIFQYFFVQPFVVFRAKNMEKFVQRNIGKCRASKWLHENIMKNFARKKYTYR